MPESRRTPQPPDQTAERIVAGLSKIALAFRHAQWTASGRSGLTPTQSQILSIVAAGPPGNPGQPATMGVKAVAEHLAVTVATASEAVGTLVDKGLLRKRPDATDGRAVVLTLTVRGKREAASAAAGGEGGSGWTSAIVAAVGDMPGAERSLLLRGLVGMVRSMQARGMVPTSRMCVECTHFRPNEYPGKPKSHHCLYIDGPIGDADLRIDCAEMQPAGAPERERLWEVFVNGQPLDRHGPGRARPGTRKSTSRRAVHKPSKGASS